MKKKLLILIVICLSACVDNEDINAGHVNDSIVNPSYGSLSDPVSYVINSSPHDGEVCEVEPSHVQTEDIQVYFPNKTPVDAWFNFSLKQKANGAWRQVISPWYTIYAPAGTSEIILDASCHLPIYINCPGYTEVVEETFQLRLISAQTNTGTDLNLSPINYTNSDPYHAIGVRYCLGGEGWNGGGSGGGGIGGG